MLITKYFCDRCKKLIPEEDDVVRLTLRYDIINRANNTAHVSNSHCAELCPECFGKLFATLGEIARNRNELEKIDDSLED